MNEADTRAELIDPQLRAAGWITGGDVLVQRGTIHDWENCGDVPCIIAFILCAANPLVFDGKIVSAKG